MKCMKNLLIVALLMAVTCSFGGDWFRVYKVEDTSPALRVKNLSTEDLRIDVKNEGTGVLYVVIDDHTNSINGMRAACDTIGEMAALVRACTNTSGEKLVEVDSYCALLTDPTIGANNQGGLLLNVTNTIRPGKWSDDTFMFDTSTNKIWGAYSPSFGRGGLAGGKTLRRVFGNCVGTGDITLNVYVDQTEVFERVRPEVFAANTNTTIAELRVMQAEINEVLDLPVAQGGSILIRASRVGGTATTGSLGATLETD